MEMPEYHLRFKTESEAGILRVSLNDQRRIQWERCANLRLTDGAVDMLDGTPVPESLDAFCKKTLALIESCKKEAPASYASLVSMGKLAEETHTLAHRIAPELFDLLIWTEADLKNGLVANRGLDLLADSDQEKFILQGQHNMSEGNFAQAEEQYRKALELPGNIANLYSFLAVALAKQGKNEAAAEAINISIEKAGRKTGGLVRGAVLNLEAGNTEKVQEYILRLAEKSSYPDTQALQISRLAMRVGLDYLGRNITKTLVESGNGDENALEHLLNITVQHEGEKAVFELVRAHMDGPP